MLTLHPRSRRTIPCRKRMRGAAAVELALISILLVMLVLATVDFARAMFVYDQLTKAARRRALPDLFDPTIAAEYPTARRRTACSTARPARPIPRRPSFQGSRLG
ncbi:MAG: pilus assembly protein [Rhodocyclaceae bacterium]